MIASCPQPVRLLAGCLLFATLALLPAGCQSPSAVRELSGQVFGAGYHITYVAGEQTPAAAVVRQQIETLFAEVDGQMSTYRNDSEISRFNASPSTDPVSVSPALAQVVALSLEVSEQTGGAFDITVQPLVRLWNFQRRMVRFEPPSDAAVEAALQRVGSDKLFVSLDPPTLRKSIPDLELDLSAIAVGFTSDLVAARLASLGVSRMMVELSGEICLRGERPAGGPWRIAIETPIVGKMDVSRVLTLTDTSLATSGNYRNFQEYKGVRYGHSIDPATGRPAVSDLGSVTVIAPTAAQADAFATALMVMGHDTAYNWAVEHDLAALLIAGEEGGFRQTQTPRFTRQLQTHSLPPAP